MVLISPVSAEDTFSMSELKSFSFRLPQFKEEAKSYVGANMKKVTVQRMFHSVSHVLVGCGSSFNMD